MYCILCTVREIRITRITVTVTLVGEAYGLLLNKDGNLEVFKQEDLEVSYPFPTKELAEIFLRNNKTNILLYTRELIEWKKENSLS